MELADFTYSITEQPASRRQIVVEVTPQVMTKQADHVLTELSTQFKLPGFRPGKVPAEVARQRISPEQLRAAILDHVVPRVLELIVGKTKLRVLGAPTLEVKEIGEGKPLKFEASIDVMPDAKLADYHDIRLKEEKVELTDKMVDEALLTLRHQKAKTGVVSRAAAKGDLVEIDFTGRQKGVVKDQLTSKRYPVILGEGKLVPGFEDQVVGLKRGETKTFSIVLAKTNLPVDLAGQKIEFEVKVNEVQAVELPELTKDFAQSFGATSVDELGRLVRKQLQREAELATESQFDAKIIAELLKRLTVEVPETLVHDAIHRRLHELEEQVKSQGLSFADYLTMIKQTEDSLHEALRPEALEQTKIGFALAEVAKTEKIPLNDQADIPKVMDRLRQIARGEENKAKEK